MAAELLPAAMSEWHMHDGLAMTLRNHTFTAPYTVVSVCQKMTRAPSCRWRMISSGSYACSLISNVDLYNTCVLRFDK